MNIDVNEYWRNYTNFFLNWMWKMYILENNENCGIFYIWEYEYDKILLIVFMFIYVFVNNCVYL